MTAWKKCLNRYDINLVKAYDINSVRNTKTQVIPRSGRTIVAGIGIAGVTLGFSAVLDVAQLDPGLGIGDLHVARCPHVGVAHQILAFAIDLQAGDPAEVVVEAFILVGHLPADPSRWPCDSADDRAGMVAPLIRFGITHVAEIVR